MSRHEETNQAATVKHRWKSFWQWHHKLISNLIPEYFWPVQTLTLFWTRHLMLRGPEGSELTALGHWVRVCLVLIRGRSYHLWSTVISSGLETVKVRVRTTRGPCCLWALKLKETKSAIVRREWTIETNNTSWYTQALGAWVHLRHRVGDLRPETHRLWVRLSAGRQTLREGNYTAHFSCSISTGSGSTLNELLALWSTLGSARQAALRSSQRRTYDWAPLTGTGRNSDGCHCTSVCAGKPHNPSQNQSLSLSERSGWVSGFKFHRNVKRFPP